MSDNGNPNHEGDLQPELRVEFEPYEERLAELGITLNAFEEALARAIDEYAESVETADAEEDILPFEDMPVEIGNQTFRVAELADVAVSADFDGRDFDDESE